MVVEPTIVESVLGAMVDESVEVVDGEADSLVDESVANVLGVSGNASVEPLDAIELSVIVEAVDVTPGANVVLHEARLYDTQADTTGSNTLPVPGQFCG